MTLTAHAIAEALEALAAEFRAGIIPVDEAPETLESFAATYRADLQRRASNGTATTTPETFTEGMTQKTALEWLEKNDPGYDWAADDVDYIEAVRENIRDHGTPNE